MKFDDILAGCIEAIEQGATVEECLQRYPTHAAALEPLLRMVVSLSRESKTQMSLQAFARGRAMLATRAQQRWVQQNAAAIQHRRSPTAVAPQPHPSQRSHDQQNGVSPRRRPLSARRAHRGWGIPRFMGMALLLLLIIGVTTFTRYIVVSLPGAPFYSVKSTGEQVVEILMEAAGEDIAWHAGQAERRLQDLARMTQQETATVQTLSRAVEEHWASVLDAAQRLPPDERSVVLQARLARLQELEAAWALPQGAAPSVATLTVRKLITAGEQLLAEPSAADILATSTVTPTAPPTNTATPLLQATPTAPRPVLIGSATPTVAPTATMAPATVTPIPPPPTTALPPATPLPEMTLVIPHQETADDESGSSTSESSNPESSDTEPSDTGEDENDSEESPSSSNEPVVSTPMPPLAPENATPSVTNTVATSMATPVVTTDGALTVIPITEQPVATAEEGTPQATVTIEAPLAITTRTALPPTATPAPELSATSTLGPKPTSQPAATKTPKPTATHTNDDDVETPDATDASTAAPPTPVERTPAPTTQPTVNPTPPPQEATISAPATPVASPPATPRPTAPSGEVTKVVQP